KLVAADVDDLGPSEEPRRFQRTRLRRDRTGVTSSAEQHYDEEFPHEQAPGRSCKIVSHHELGVAASGNDAPLGSARALRSTTKWRSCVNPGNATRRESRTHSTIGPRSPRR